jgi:hypothetical protein
MLARHGRASIQESAGCVLDWRSSWREGRMIGFDGVNWGRRPSSV